MHWKGLWATFGHHGEVIDAFIPAKSRNGKRFGFVRFSSKVDANRAISRLNGSRLYRYRVLVALAKFGSRTSYWRKVNRTQSDCEQKDDSKQRKQNLAQTSTINTQKEHNHSGGTQANIEKGKNTILPSLEKEKRRRVIGFVEEETLWKLQSYTTSDSDAGRIHDRLCSWGLGEIKVKRLAGRVFLLEFEDNELYGTLQKTEWSTLSEVFTEVHPWSESFITPKRVVWIELAGIPPHCWNHQTFKRIAELWGEFIFLGENALHSSGLEKVMLVLATKQWERIEMVIDLEVGNVLFPVRVSETLSPKEKNGNWYRSRQSRSWQDQVTSLKSSFSSSSGGGSERRVLIGDEGIEIREGINSINLGNANLFHDNLAEKDFNRHIGESEQQGGVNKTSWVDIVAKSKTGPEELIGEDTAQTQNSNKSINQSMAIGSITKSTFRPSPAQKDTTHEGINNGQSPASWAASIDKLNNDIIMSQLGEDQQSQQSDEVSVEEEEDDFPSNNNKFDRILKRGREKKGLGTEVRWSIIRRLVRIHKIEMLLLQETKVFTFDLDKARKLWGGMEVDFLISPAVGQSGGLVTLWDKKCFSIENSVIHQRFVAPIGKWKSSNVEAVMVNVYAPNGESDQIPLWADLLALKSLHYGKWIAARDFNTVCHKKKRSGCSQQEMNFNKFIDEAS
ncbi:hypothetical protein V6N13_091212 [Hibiscus sabdariffa]